MRRTIHPLAGKLVLACACPACGKVITKEEEGCSVPVTDVKDLAEKRRFCANLVPGWQLDRHGGKSLDESGEPIWGTRPCGQALFEISGARRHLITEFTSCN